MLLAHVKSFAAAGLAAAFLLGGAAAPQAQTQDEFNQVATECENNFNDSPAADDCTFTSVTVSSSTVTKDGVSTRTWTCEITASCVIDRDDGSSDTVSLSLAIPRGKVSQTTVTTDSQGRDILSYPGAPSGL